MLSCTPSSDTSPTDVLRPASDAPEGGVLTSAFRRMRGRLVALAQGITGNRMEAEDAVQDAFCRMWERHPGLSDTSVAAAMLTTTTRHTSIDILRRRVPTEDIDGHPEAGRDCELPEPERRERQSEAELRWRRVEVLIRDTLSPEQQHILRRRDYEGTDFETIADELGMQPDTVRVNLSRARRKILQLYQTLYESPHHE